MKKILRKLKALLFFPIELRRLFFEHRKIILEQMKLQDIQYRDTLDIITGRKKLLHNNNIVLKTDYPVAYDSPDHLNPLGTIQDNTRNYAFYKKCHSLYGDDMSFLDIGCSGGGLVFEFALNGHLAIGLEGSDLSKRRGRANWRTIPNNLFTCDVTKPFLLFNKSKPSEAHLFDVISCWEVLEHIPENQLDTMLENIKKHLKPNGVFVGSISKNPNDPLHVTIKNNDWWINKLSKMGLAMTIGYEDVFEFAEFCRGIGGGIFDSFDYRQDPDKGLHFVGRIENDFK